METLFYYNNNSKAPEKYNSLRKVNDNKLRIIVLKTIFKTWSFLVRHFILCLFWGLNKAICCVFEWIMFSVNFLLNCTNSQNKWAILWSKPKHEIIKGNVWSSDSLKNGISHTMFGCTTYTRIALWVLYALCFTSQNDMIFKSFSLSQFVYILHTQQRTAHTIAYM